MANFVALTPPLGQQPWGPIQILAPFSVATPLLGLGIGFDEVGYPHLTAPFRVLILKKYPGTIFPDPDFQDVFPSPDPDPIHIQELWDKYNAVLEDDHTYDDLPTTNLGVFVERELGEWIAEFDASRNLGVIVIADRTIMGSDNSKSKKRAPRDSFENGAVTEEFRATKVTKTESPITKVDHKSSSVKKQYDGAYPAHLVVDQDEPSYIMAQNYIKTYAKSNEKHAHRVREIIAKQGLEPITQRCAKFFAWGLQQPIRRFIKTESDVDSFTDSEQLESDEDGIFDDVRKYNKEDSPELDEVINFRPQNLKPSFKFNESSLGSRVGSFLSEMKEANEKLVSHIASGNLNDYNLEVDDAEEYIEMNLGLGVLEEKADSSSDEEDEGADEVKNSVVIEEI